MDSKKGRVCVTGGTGYVASWLVMKLLQNGYSVNTTVRTDHPDISYLKNLPNAPERLQIFNANLDKPETFAPAVKDCVGVFHLAHPMEWNENETEETKTKRAIGGLLGILQASLDSKTVKRFVYTSSASTVIFNASCKNLDTIDEKSWTDFDFLRSLGLKGASYVITKTLAERTALEFGEKNGSSLEVVTLVPPFIHGDEEYYKYFARTSLVHVDDVARAHIHVFEYPKAKGRYICSAVGVTIDKLSEFLSTRYPEYRIPKPDSLKGIEPVEFSELSSKKLMETGFEFRCGLEEMFDGAIRSCKEKGLL
ncbi:hypothetical protein ABFS83_02G150400 [Erythranthe nasuta]